ncbi:MAG: hypothetical protein J0I12_33180 [Candidatus Eremiobacteraeota bacterium]|nr:hypothetical protein [Candidatus Eremiobacteraeota bacterium]
MQSDLRKIRTAIAIVIAGLLVSGLTAFPIERELNWIVAHIPANPWLLQVQEGITMMYAHYPWIAYGTDWLAFAHILLAVLFLGPYRDPVRNLWVLEFGLIACVGVLPLALICGPIRGIPFYWRLIDCSFGIIAFVPLWIARSLTLGVAEQPSLREQPTYRAS